jgi:hypothetical protein
MVHCRAAGRLVGPAVDRIMDLRERLDAHRIGPHFIGHEIDFVAEEKSVIS